MGINYNKKVIFLQFPLLTGHIIKLLYDRMRGAQMGLVIEVLRGSS